MPDKTLEDAARRVELELKRLIGVLNDEVVPAIRKDGGRALRRVASELAKLADSLERRI
jgi:hypothetical protein